MRRVQTVFVDARSAVLTPTTVFLSAPPRRFDGGNVDFLHRQHRLKGTPCLIATSSERVGQSARGDLPGEAPAVLAPTALTFLAAIADDRVPVAVGLFLIVSRDLEGKGLAVLELRAAVETETGNAQDGELYRQLIALLAARVIRGRLVNSGHSTIRKGGGVEARRLMRVLVEPEADRVFWFHVGVLLAGSPRWLWQVLQFLDRSLLSGANHWKVASACSTIGCADEVARFTDPW